MDKKILIVDDEKPILKVLASLFKNQGYSPHCTMNGAEAIEIVGVEGVRVCFLDLRMPVMDGMQVCRVIKNLDPGAYVFALSAFAGSYTNDEFHDVGFNGYFNKPFKPQDLLSACADAFENLETGNAAGESG